MPAKPAKSIAQRLKDARGKLNLTQAQAADKWEINIRTIQAWEASRNTPSGLALRALDQILREAGE